MGGGEFDAQSRSLGSGSCYAQNHFCSYSVYVSFSHLPLKTLTGLFGLTHTLVCVGMRFVDALIEMDGEGWLASFTRVECGTKWII